MSKREDEYDLETYNKAMDEYKKDPTTYTLDEVERELSISCVQFNQGTINAMNNVLKDKNLSKEFNSVEELMNDLNKEDDQKKGLTIAVVDLFLFVNCLFSFILFQAL